MLEFVAAVISQTSRSFMFSGTLVLSFSIAVSAFGADRHSASDPAVSIEGMVLESALPADHADHDLFALARDTGAFAVPTHIPLPAGAIVSVDDQTGHVAIIRLPTQRLFFDNYTMILDVADRSLLTGLSAGDKVRFDYEHESHRWILTRLEHSN